MAVQKQNMPSFASTISVLSIVFYCAGFLRVELKLHKQKKRINALESVAEAKSPSNDADIKINKNASDCSDLLKSGHTQSGLYSVNPDGRGHFTVYCDMRTDGGGWTVFQRRQDGSVDFYWGWTDYKADFGQLTAEFWLGNDKIHRLTASKPSSLRVELEDWNGMKAYAKYGKFNIGDEQVQYRLEVGSYSGTAGDSLTVHNNMAFTTKDRDNDRWGGNCAVFWTGAWWYHACHNSNLNGQYLGDKSDCRGARWSGFIGCLSVKFTEMKLRPSS